jgi:hypothetical protein
VDGALDAFKGASLPPPEKVRLLVRLNTQAGEARDRGETERALAFFRALVKEAGFVLIISADPAGNPGRAAADPGFSLAGDGGGST